jgi:hypothetical protein
VDERPVGLRRSSWIHEVHGNVADEVGVGEVRGEAGTELAGLDSGVVEVVGGDLAEVVVVDVEGPVGDVEVVEVAPFAALREGAELGGDQLGWCGR